MKKILSILVVAALFLMLPITTATSVDIFSPLRANDSNRDIDWTGHFVGAIGHPNRDTEDATVVGYIGGLFKLRGRGGFFAGNITSEDQSKNGRIAGIFGRNLLVGRLIGDERSLPFVGFLGFRAENSTFFGRAMTIVGPPVYIWGSFTTY